MDMTETNNLILADFFLGRAESDPDFQILTFEGAGVREDQPGARLARRQPLPRRGGADGSARVAWLPHRRLRLHHLHRQLGTTAC